jgi:hypothetical protein
MVGQRQREIGVRLALGARPAEVLSMVLRSGMRLAGLGVALGVAGALALSQVMGSILYGVAPHDPLSHRNKVLSGVNVSAPPPQVTPSGSARLPAALLTNLSNCWTSLATPGPERSLGGGSGRDGEQLVRWSDQPARRAAGRRPVLSRESTPERTYFHWLSVAQASRELHGKSVGFKSVLVPCCRGVLAHTPQRARLKPAPLA